MQRVIAVVGPTASGKTAYAIQLARTFRGIVISADSRQVYKDMRVNTATPSGTWRKPNAYYRRFLGNRKRYIVNGIPHLLMDEVAPDEQFTLADYQKRVYAELAALRKHWGASRNTQSAPPVFLVGGTGLYIDAVCQGFVLPKFSARRRAQLARKPLRELLVLLKEHDPATFRVIDKHNVRRVLRAVEASITGVPFSKQRSKKRPPFDVLYLGINPPRDVLERRLHTRAREMFKQGLLAETQRLVARYDLSLPALSAIGYADAAKVLAGKMTQAEAVERRVVADRRYAKRQMTWFKRNTDIHWNAPIAQAKRILRKFLN